MTKISRILTAVFVAAILGSALPLSAAANTAQSNTVTINIAGGNATALAACLNIAKQGSKADVDQVNRCKNKAFAAGGNVVLKNVSILAVQDNSTHTGKTSNQSNTVNLTIQGGNATALAACVNVAAASQKGKADVDQANRCKNTAIAVGGSVILKNVDITIAQANS